MADPHTPEGESPGLSALQMGSLTPWLTAERIQSEEGGAAGMPSPFEPRPEITRPGTVDALARRARLTPGVPGSSPGNHFSSLVGLDQSLGGTGGNLHDAFMTPQQPRFAQVFLGGIADSELENEDSRTFPTSATGSPWTSRRSVQQGFGAPIHLPQDNGYSLFHSLFTNLLRGNTMVADLVKECVDHCRELSASISEEREGRLRATEKLLLKQEAELLWAEAATWALLWQLHGKEPVDMYDSEDGVEPLNPPTSEQLACEFIQKDPSGQAQLLLNIVEWLEGLVAHDIDCYNLIRAHSARVGMRTHTRAALQNPTIRVAAAGGPLVESLDPDAATREEGSLHTEDQEEEKNFLEDVWMLIRAGRLAQARQLCREAGQPWRAVCLGGCGDAGPSPSAEGWRECGGGREAQAREMESGTARQRRLWKWTSFCASEKIATEASSSSKYEAAIFAAMCGNLQRMLPICDTWEAALWAIAKSWLDATVDVHLYHQGAPPGGAVAMGLEVADRLMARVGRPHNWPRQILGQTPLDLDTLSRKLATSEAISEAARQGGKDPQHMIQLSLIRSEIDRVLDILTRLIGTRTTNAGGNGKPTGHPQLIRFAAHLVIALRLILPQHLLDKFREKLRLTGDAILSTYTIHLMESGRAALVPLYACQMAGHICVTNCSNMLGMTEDATDEAKERIMDSILLSLPFSSEDKSEGTVSAILDRVLSLSRDHMAPPPAMTKVESLYDHHRGEAMRKARALQWLCFPPPDEIMDASSLSVELAFRALEHSNLLLREMALGSLSRSGDSLVEAKVVFSLLHNVSKAFDLLGRERKEVLDEHKHWTQYFRFEEAYREWVSLDQANTAVAAAHGPGEDGLSKHERERAEGVAKDALQLGMHFLSTTGPHWLRLGTAASRGPSPSEAAPPPASDAFRPRSLHLRALVSVVDLSLSDPTQPMLTDDHSACALLTEALLVHAGSDLVNRFAIKVEVLRHPSDSTVLEVDIMSRLHIAGSSASPSEAWDVIVGMLAYGIKGDLRHLSDHGLALRPLRIDTWCFIEAKESGEWMEPAAARDLCRTCCLPQLFLRCWEMKQYLAGSGDPTGVDDTSLVEMVTSEEKGFYSLFTQRQLQEALQMEVESQVPLLDSQLPKRPDRGGMR